MRRRISLIIVFVLLFCVGCGSMECDPMENSASAEQDSVTVSKDQQTDCAADMASDPESAESGEIDYKDDGSNAGSVSGETAINLEDDDLNSEQNVEYVAVNTEHVFEQYTDRETGKTLVDMNYHVISLEEGNETLEQTISKWMVKRQQDLEEDGLDLMVKTKNKQKETGNENLTSSLWHEITIYRADNRLISFMERQYSYCAGAWNNDYQCVNFDVESGKQVLLSNLLVDKAGFQQAVIAYCLEELKNTYTNSEIDDAFADEIYNAITESEKWCLDASGFVFVYEDDEMEYSNEGVIYVHVPYEIVSDYMNKQYIWGDTYGVAALAYGQTSTIVIDGVEKEICVEKQYDEYYIEQVQVVYGDTVADVGKYMRTEDIYLLNHTNWKYLILDADMASNDYQTYFYQLTGDSIGNSFYLTGDIDSANVRTDSVTLGLTVDVLGTYRTYPEYFILDGGGVASSGAEFEIEHFSYNYCDLVTIRELPVMKDSNMTYLPVGSRLRILETNNASWAKFLLLGSMEEVTIFFTREENYIINIDGLSEYAYFESLPYAG